MPIGLCEASMVMVEMVDGCEAGLQLHRPGACRKLGTGELLGVTYGHAHERLVLLRHDCDFSKIDFGEKG
jgi:hypothetical protein